MLRKAQLTGIVLLSLGVGLTVSVFIQSAAAELVLGFVIGIVGGYLFTRERC